MNKKIFLFTLILLILAISIFAQNNEIAIYNTTILPTSTKIGKVSNGNLYSTENYFKEMFKSEYSLNWIDQYIKDSYKYSFTKENSKILATILPIDGPIYTSNIFYKPNNRTINVLLDNNTIVKIIFELKSNKIITMEII